jgi:hypothetical protein
MMQAKFFAVAPLGISAFECAERLPDELVASGFERAVPGELYRSGYRCPVNGDGYRCWRQLLVTETSNRIVGSIARDDLGSVAI